MKKTIIQKYIETAINEEKKEFLGYRFENIHIDMNMEASWAPSTLAGALLAQAEANKADSEAMLQLAKSLKPTDACAIRLINSEMD